MAVKGKLSFLSGRGRIRSNTAPSVAAAATPEIAGKVALALVCMEVPPPGVYIALKAVVQIRNGNYRNLEILMFVRLEIGKT